MHTATVLIIGQSVREKEVEMSETSFRRQEGSARTEAAARRPYAGNDPICWDWDAGNLCPGRMRAKTAEARVKPVDLPAIRLDPSDVAVVLSAVGTDGITKEFPQPK